MRTPQKDETTDIDQTLPVAGQSNIEALANAEKLVLAPKRGTIIGLVGHRQCGHEKLVDIFKEVLKAHKKEPPVVLDFWSYARREIVENLKGVTLDTLINEPIKHLGLLQWWTVEYRRGLKGADYWQKLAADDLEDLVRKGKTVIVCPIRHINDWEWLKKEFKAATMTIIAQNRLPIGGHASETEWSSIPTPGIFFEFWTGTNGRKQVEQFLRKIKFL